MDLIRRELRLDLGAEGLVGPDHGAGLVGHHVVDHGEEGLTFLPRLAAPVRRGTDLGPRFLDEAAFVARVVVGLDVVRGEITGFLQVGGETLHVGRQGKGRAHLARAEAGGPHAGDDRGPRGGTDRGGGKGVRVAHRLLREGVQVRGDRIGIAVAAQRGTEILGGDPEQVGPVGGTTGRRQQAERMARQGRRRQGDMAGTVTEIARLGKREGRGAAYSRLPFSLSYGGSDPLPCPPMSPEPPEFLHPRPGGFSRRDLIRTGALAGTAAAALAPFHAGAQEAAGRPRPNRTNAVPRPRPIRS